MIIGQSDYRKILQAVFEKKLKLNARYSMRAFARDIGLSQAQLSNVLSGSRGLSSAAASSIATRLKFSEEETRYFNLLVDQQSARSRSKQKLAQKELDQWADATEPKALQLQKDVFSTVSDWYHFAILQAMKLPQFESNPEWIAKHFGLTVPTVIAALDRLDRLDLIEKVSGKYQVTTKTVMTPEGISTEATRKYLTQLLEKSILALQNQPIEERFFQSLTLPIPVSSIPSSKEEIRNFLKKFSRNQSQALDDSKVYCINVQLFQLSEKTK